MPPRLLMTLAAVLAAAPGLAHDGSTDAAALQGEWQLVAAEMLGEKLPDELIADVTRGTV